VASGFCIGTDKQFQKIRTDKATLRKCRPQLKWSSCNTVPAVRGSWESQLERQNSHVTYKFLY